MAHWTTKGSIDWCRNLPLQEQLRDWTLTWLAIVEGLESRIESQARAGKRSSCLMLRTRTASHICVCTGKKVLHDDCAAKIDQAFGAEVEGAWWWGWKTLEASWVGSHVSIKSPVNIWVLPLYLVGTWCLDNLGRLDNSQVSMLWGWEEGLGFYLYWTCLLLSLESRFYSVTSGDSMSCFGDRKKSLVTAHEILQKEQMVLAFALQPPWSHSIKM